MSNGFVFDGWRIDLRRARQVREIRERERALAIVRAMSEQLGIGAVEDVLDQVGFVGPRDDPESVLRAAAEVIANGTFLLVLREQVPRLMDAPRTVRLVDLVDPLEGPAGVEPRTELRLSVIHETGGWFPGAAFVVETPGGKLVDGKLDDASTWLLDDVEGGSFRLRFLEPLELSEAEQRRPSSGSVVAAAEDVACDVGKAARVSIKSGRAVRIVVKIPPATPSIAVPVGAFARGEAFPTPAMASALDALSDRLVGDAAVRLTAIGHGDGLTDQAEDKALSDTRSEVLRAVLLNDVDAFAEISDREGWSLMHDQAMLRAVGCNPAAIDGVAGPLTEQATRWFQHEYGRGYHDPDGLDAPLDETGELDGPTRSALRKAYLLSMSPQLVPENLSGPDVVGCAGFNRTEAAFARAGDIVCWPSTDRVPKSFPCVHGDPAACRLDDRGERRCRFHREAIDVNDEPARPRFYDFDWLVLPSGKVNLSALTTLPDGTAVRFQVVRDVEDYDGMVIQHHGTQPRPVRGTPTGALFDGIVRMGVCVALWTPPADWDPFAWRDWFRDIEDDDDDGGPGFRPPLFAIEYDGGWAFSRPPGERIDRFMLSNSTRTGLALANDASFVAFRAEADRVVVSRERRTDEHIQIVGWCSYREFLEAKED